jgi:hypothetical protein
MHPIITILCPAEMNDSDSSFAKLVHFLGIGSRIICLDDCLTDFQITSNQDAKKWVCLALGYPTLANIYGDNRISNSFKIFLREKVSFLFVYNIQESASESNVLDWLTDGVIKSVVSFSSNVYEYEVNREYKEICMQFSGLLFGPINSEVDIVFDVRQLANETDNLICINKRPLFLRTKQGNCQMFFLGTNQILDIDNYICEPINTRECFSRMIPIMMFVKYVFKQHCWHNDISQACLIIDDPLLNRQYGFLNYQRLFEATINRTFFTTVAFIPWNYKRTNAKIAGLFVKKKDNFSLCVHGCDHTQNEFGSTDFNELNYLTRMATDRMESHEHITGLPYDKVMIFPQGVFSTNSMRVLKSNNYLAAVNSDAFPIDVVNRLRVRDFLGLTIMNYENFPLFLRKDPKKILDLALDLFLGKPVLIAVHHDFFKPGYEEVVELAEKLDLIAGNIQWRSLGDIVQQSYLLQQEDENTFNVKLYASRSIISNTSDTVKKYSITKNEKNNVPIKGVFLDGKEVTYKIENQLLKTTFEIKPKKSGIVEIVYNNLYPYAEENTKVIKKSKVWVRRHLSEIRDNYLSRSQALLSVANKLKRMMP